MRPADQTEYIVQCVREGGSMYMDDARKFLAEHDAHVRAKRDAEITYWLGKKALEYRGGGSKQDVVRADVVDLMASKISRGAVRPNNTMLPAGVAPDFFQPGHTYAQTEYPQYDWQFRCDTVTTHPEDGERTALGWRHFRGVWEAYAYGEDDWEIHLHVGLTNVTGSETAR